MMTESMDFAHCSCCSLKIEPDDRTYIAMDMGTELIDALLKKISRQVTEESVVCSKCFKELTLCVASKDLVPPDKQSLPFKKPKPRGQNPDDYCFFCHTSLFQKRWFGIKARSQLSTIPPDAKACYYCARKANQRKPIDDNPKQSTYQVIKQPKPVLHEPCFWCKQSLKGKRMQVLTDGEEKEYISAVIYPRGVPKKATVCWPCWMFVQRQIRRERRENDKTDTTTTSINESNLDHTVTQETTNPKRDIHLDFAGRVVKNKRVCIVSKCMESKKSTISAHLMKKLLTEYHVLVSRKFARVCEKHSSLAIWDAEFVQKCNFPKNFTAEEVEELLNITLQLNK